MKSNFVLISGLDQAVLGTVQRNSLEVLAYDLDLAKKILRNGGWAEEKIEHLLRTSILQEDYPLFIAMDPTIIAEISGQTTIH